jgi:hypothetical protein
MGSTSRLCTFSFHRQALPASPRVEELRKVDMPAVIAGGGGGGLAPFVAASTKSELNLGRFYRKDFNVL